MRYAFGEGGTVRIPGRRYDLEKVCDATEEVLDTLALRLGGGRAELTTDRDGYDRRHPWPDPGKIVARECWREAAGLYDGVYEPVVLVTDLVKVRWYALGRPSCSYDGGRDLVVSGDGQEVDFVDPKPCLVVYGEPNRQLIAAVDEAVRGRCSRLGMTVRLARPITPLPGIAMEGHVALLEFPHETFGQGTGDIRVRCPLK